MKLDYSLKTSEERKALVEKILEENPSPSSRYLEILTNYLVEPIEKEEKKERKILTDNRLATIYKRELSFESLISQFENGEDGIYNLISNSGKGALFQPKISITQQDLDDIPELREWREAIDKLEQQFKCSEGKDAYILKKALIEMRRDQYIIKTGFKTPVNCTTGSGNRLGAIPLEAKIAVDKKGNISYSGFCLLDPAVISATLTFYNKLKYEAEGAFHKDLWYFMEDFDRLLEKSLRELPLYRRLVQLKIDGCQNAEIKQRLQEEFNTSHSVEYISALWKQKIPKLIASVAEDDYLNWYYLEVEKGHYKKCSKCGQIKLAHNKYFSKNSSSKDGWYSVCKECRNKKYRERSKK